MRSWVRIAAVALGLPLLAACAAGTFAPPPSAAVASAPAKPTIAALSISTAQDMNPDGEGKATPVVVRVFRLASAGAFEKAKYDDLFEKDEATLGPDLIGTVDILIEPGMAETFDRTLTERDRYLGFVVTYRDAERSQWRALVPVRQRNITKVDVEVGARGIVATTIGS